MTGWWFLTALNTIDIKKPESYCSGFFTRKFYVGNNLKYGDPTGIRTPVTAVKGRCPRPLDDRVVMR